MYYVIAIVALFVIAVSVVLWVELIQESRTLKKETQTVVKTIFIDSSHTATVTQNPRTGSAIGRAFVGGAIAGPAGAVIGAGTAKQKGNVNETHKTTFIVWYIDGHWEHKTVDNNSKLYNLYMSRLDLRQWNVPNEPDYPITPAYSEWEHWADEYGEICK